MTTLQHDDISDCRQAYDDAGSLMREGRSAEAKALLVQAIARWPRAAELHFGLATILMAAGQIEPAIQAFQTAILHQPTFVAAYGNVGALCLQTGRLDEAAAAFDRCIALAPRDAAGYVNATSAYHAKGEIARARDLGMRALALAPNLPEVYFNLGNLAASESRLDDAADFYRQAIDRKPTWADAHNALGLVLLQLNRPDDARGAFEDALRVDPACYAACFNRGIALRRLGRDADAITQFRTVITLRPSAWLPHVELGLLLIKQGDLPNGWSEYEWRWQSDGRPAPRTNRPQPIWNGERLDDRTLVLCAEQGFGDIIQYVRFAASLKPFVGRVLVECPSRLTRVLATCAGIDGLVGVDEGADDADMQLPLVSVARVLGVTLDTIPARTPYLHASRSPAVDAFFARHRDRTKIGICWTGSSKNLSNRARSCQPEDFAPLSTVPGTTLFSLQLTGDESLATRLDPLGIVSIDDALQQDFADTASIISSLDLVVTIDTAVAHLAGALGRPVWLLLHDDADARWMTDRTDTPWYPTMRLFRQRRRGGWNHVFADVVDALQSEE